MKVTLERLPESRVLLDIEVDPERLEKSLESAYRRVANKARIPGFRPGKAPRPIVERMVGREGLIREALDDLVPDVYNEVLEQEQVQAVDQPELEMVAFDPVHFKATVPVRPTVELNDYKDVRVEREDVEVTGEMVDEQIDTLRRRYATQVPVERPIQWGDVVIADVESTVDDEPFVEDRDAEFPVREDAPLLVEGLNEVFLGMSPGDEKEVDLPLPDDFQVERLQGKTAHFKLSVKDVKEEQLPELDDDFAQEVNPEEFPTFAALRERIETDLRKSYEQAADAKLQQAALDQMVEQATLEFPRVFVEREIDGLVRENLGNDREQYSAYLSRIGQTEEVFRDTMRETAEQRVRRSLVLSALTDAEGIEVTDADVEAELDRLVEPAGEEAGRLRELFASEDGSSTIRRNLLSEKTLARVREIATLDGTGSDSPEGDTAEAQPAGDEPTEKKEDAE